MDFFKNKKVIVAEDSKTSRFALVLNLEMLGFEKIVDAENGRVALDKIKSALAEDQIFDIILSDWNMPEMDGLELLKAIRLIDEYKDTPFIMVTSKNSGDEIDAVESQPGTIHIEKPIDYDKLQVVIENMMKK